MPDAIWIDRPAVMAELGERLSARATLCIDTEFLRERTFFPKLCLIQLAAGTDLWCADALAGGLEALTPVLTAPGIRKVIHAARQDLEAIYLTTRRVISPIFDTQIAAGCVGFKPQVGYAELVQTLLGITLAKGQTRTDWSKRPLTREQLDYAADDVRYLEDIAARLQEKLHALGRDHWVTEDCRALEDVRLYDPDPEQAWQRLKGLAALPPAVRDRARALAVWREKLARGRDLPRSWILADPALFAVAQSAPGNRAELAAVHALPVSYNEGFATGILDALRSAAGREIVDRAPVQDLRPTPEQKALIDRLARVVDARAAELDVSPELLAPRGELKSLALGRRDVNSLDGWRRAEIGERLLNALGA